jgi:hypothetical protein
MASNPVTSTERRRHYPEDYKELKADLKLLHCWKPYPVPCEELSAHDRWRWDQTLSQPESGLYPQERPLEVSDVKGWSDLCISTPSIFGAPTSQDTANWKRYDWIRANVHEMAYNSMEKELLDDIAEVKNKFSHAVTIYKLWQME